MITREMLKQIYEKSQNDLNEYEQSFINDTPQTIINNAIDIYHGQNFFYMIEEFVQNFDEEDNYCAIAENVVNKIINFKDNVVEFWVNHRYDVRHSEKYNLEHFDDFVSVLEIIFNNLENDNANT